MTIRPISDSTLREIDRLVAVVGPHAYRGFAIDILNRPAVDVLSGDGKMTLRFTGNSLKHALRLAREAAERGDVARAVAVEEEAERG